MVKSKDFRRLLSITAFMGLLAISNHAMAVGRFLPTTSLAGEDATNRYFNPAALVTLQAPQFVVQDFNLYNHKSFSGTMTNPGIHSPIAEIGSADTNGITNVGRGVTSIAAFYVSTAVPLTCNRLFFGADIIPYPQLGLEYPNNSILRYDVVKAFERAVDINTSLGLKISPQLSVGLGLDSDYLNENLKIKVRTELLTTQDSILDISANSWNFGWHGGFLYIPTRATKIGLAYHSPIVAHLGGNSAFYPRGVTRREPLTSVLVGDSTVILPFAGITTLTIHQMFTPRWGGYATTEFRNWSIYKSDHAYNIAAPTASGVENTISPKNLRNNWYFSLTTHYAFTEKAIGFLSAAHTTMYSVAINRDALSSYAGTNEMLLGMHYQFTRAIGADFAAVHVFRNTLAIHKVSVSGGSNISGTSRETTDIGFAQVLFDFV